MLDFADLASICLWVEELSNEKSKRSVDGGDIPS